MKKVLLVFISILTFSFILVNNNTYAQEVKYPSNIMKVVNTSVSFVQENANTYEFRVYYQVYRVQINSIAENEYFLVNDIGLNFRKGINRNTNSYELEGVNAPPMAQDTYITLLVTVTKSYVRDNYNYPEDSLSINLLFNRDTALYILYQSDTGSIDYNSGYTAGYDAGFNYGRIVGYDEGYDVGKDEGYDIGYDYGYDIGYDFGYDDGYTVGVNESSPEAYEKGRQDGYNEASKEFKENFGLKVDVWLVPAIIIVFAVGIFVTYRRGRE